MIRPLGAPAGFSDSLRGAAAAHGDWTMLSGSGVKHTPGYQKVKRQKRLSHMVHVWKRNLGTLPWHSATVAHTALVVGMC